jgi:hypothetical protein
LAAAEGESILVKTGLIIKELALAVATTIRNAVQ